MFFLISNFRFQIVSNTAFYCGLSNTKKKTVRSFEVLRYLNTFVNWFTKIKFDYWMDSSDKISNLECRILTSIFRISNADFRLQKREKRRTQGKWTGILLKLTQSSTNMKEPLFLHQEKESSIFILNAISTSENTEALTATKKNWKIFFFFWSILNLNLRNDLHITSHTLFFKLFFLLLLLFLFVRFDFFLFFSFLFALILLCYLGVCFVIFLLRFFFFLFHRAVSKNISVSFIWCMCVCSHWCTRSNTHWSLLV